MLQKKACKKKLLIFLIAFLFSISLESKMFLGKVVFPRNVLPALRLYYNGEKLITDIDSEKEYKTVPFSIDEHLSVEDLHILIVYDLSFISEQNNIKHLRIPASGSYKFYALEATRTWSAKGGELLSWNVFEQRLENNIIPDNTIIFLYDPKLVKGLDVPVWRKEDQIRLLPAIIIDPRVKQEDIMRAMDIACLAGMNIDLVHGLSKTTATHDKKIVSTLPAPRLSYR